MFRTRATTRTLCALVVAFAILGGASCTTQGAQGSVAVPASIDATGANDVTAQLQAFIDRVPEGRRIELKAGGRYRIEDTLEMRDRENLTIDGNGALLFATTPGYRERAQIRFLDSVNITITDLKIKGANPHAGMGDAAWDVSKEAQHGINMLGVNGVMIDRVHITDVYGDFVYLGRSEEWTNNATIRNSRFERNGRMGVAITGARNVRIEGNHFEQMRRSTFDLEWHDPGFGVDNLLIQNNYIGPGRFGVLHSVAGPGSADNVTFQNNRLGRELYIWVDPGQGARQRNWKVLNNRAAGLAAAPSLATMSFSGVDGLTVSGNYQEMNPGRNMYGVRATSSCNVAVSRNTFPGAVGQVLLEGKGPSC